MAIEVLLAESQAGSLLPVLHALASAKRHRFRVQRAQGLDQVTAALQPCRFDAVVADIAGAEAKASRLLPLAQTHPRAAVIAVIAAAEERAAQQLLDDGIDAYLLWDEICGPVVEHCIAQAVARHEKAGGELAQVNRALRALIEASPLPIVSIDTNNAVTGWNPAAERVFGWTAQEVIGQRLPTIPPESAAEAAAVWQRVMEGDAFVSVESVRVRRDGSRLDVSIAYGPVHDTSGRITGFMAIIDDVTEAKRAREALSESERRYRELADSLPQIVFETDENLRLTFANRGARLAFGFAENDPVLGLPVMAMIAPEDRERAAAGIERLFRGEALGVSEYTALRRDGSTFSIAAHSTPILRDGRPAGLRGVIFDITDRIQSEQALRASEAKLRALLDNASDAIFVHREDHGPAGKFVEVNEAACAWLGYSREELLSLCPGDIDASRGRAYWVKATAGTLEQGRVQFETALAAKDGEYIPVEISSHVFELNGERLMLAVARDTRERMRAREREAQYLRELALLSQTAMGFVQLPPGQSLEFFIASKLRALVAARRVVVATDESGSGRMDVKAVADVDALSSPYAEDFEALLSAVMSDADRVVSLSQGALVDVSACRRLASSPAAPAAKRGSCDDSTLLLAQGFSLHGRLLGLALMTLDQGTKATDSAVLSTFANQASVALQRQQVEQAFLETHAQNEQLLASIGSGLIVIDANKIVTHWNAAAEGMFGLCAAVTIGRPLGECAICWDWQSVEAATDECLATRRATRPRDIHYTRNDGRAGIISLTVSPFAAGAGVRAGALLVVSEVTDLRQAETQLSQEQKLKSIGQLAAGIAHEINTPVQYVSDNLVFLRDACDKLLALVQLYSELRQPLDSDRAAQVAGEIERQIEAMDYEYLAEEMPLAVAQSLDGIGRVAKIVLAMKEFSHPGEGNMAAIDLNRAVDSTITVSRNEWKYVAEMVTDLDPDLPPVPCFPGEINQVILNIIVNASHAIADVVGDGGNGKGTISIRTRAVDGWAEIRIADSGTGIPEAIRDRVFDPFFTTKEVGKGTGQGLAMAYNIVVNKHHGTIAFETEVGRGTTFVIRLPLADAVTDSQEATRWA